MKANAKDICEVEAKAAARHAKTTVAGEAKKS